MSTDLWITIATALTGVLAVGAAQSGAREPGDAKAPPPAIQAWIDRLTVEHAYDPETGFIVAKEVVTLPPILAEGPSLDEAIREAETAGRIVVAFATADRCAPCQQYKKSALNDPRVVEALGRSHLIATHVEVDRDKDLVQARLGSLAIPMTYALFGAERIAVLRGQRSAEELLAWLDALPADGDTARLLRDTNAWHRDRLARLASEDGWLSLVGLEWLGEGANRVGRDPAGEVVYSGFPADHLATLHVENGVVRIEPAANLPEGVSLHDLPADGVMTADTQGAPAVVRTGGVRFHIIERGGRLAVRIKDADAPARTGFKGIERFPVSETWRITAEFEPADPGLTQTMGTVIGVDAESEVAGWARFEHAGHRVRAVLFPAGDGSLYLRFGDASNGKETYPIGRYLSIPAPGTDGTVVLDFNRSYNPPCAFTPFATCTLPPEENSFAFAVEAGERSPR
jgi:uncharacterized protein (DUF1684 family)